MITETINKTNINITFELFKAVQKEKLNYIYRGNFNSDISNDIIMLTERNMLEKDNQRALRRKVYHVMVEGLQNITKHQANLEYPQDNNYGLFAIKKDNDKYYITTGNLIENADISILSTKIDLVNELDKDELRDFHREILKNGKFSEKGGAGLGLIDIAMRSGSGLKYAFDKVDQNHSYFYLSSDITDNGVDPVRTESSASFNYNLIHPLLNEENILMVFNNTFNQDSLMDMLAFIESKMAENSQMKRKMYQILIEMFQNLSKHALKVDEQCEGKSGIFYISESENNIFLNTGNYIHNEDVPGLYDRLFYLNSLDDESLENFYNERLFDFGVDTGNGAGLGLIDLRIKSGNKLIFDFKKVNNQYTFYSLRVKI